MKLIKTDFYLLWVDDNKPSRNGKYSITITGKVKKFLPDERPILWIDGCPEVIAHLPLNNAPVLEGVLLLPPLSEQEDDCWVFAAYENEDTYNTNDPYFMKVFFDHTEMKVFSSKHSSEEKPKYPQYVSMYWKTKAASSTKKYSEVDMKKAYYQGHKSGLGSEGAMTFTQMLQSQSPAIYPVAFEPEYEVVPDDNNNGSGVIFTNNMKEVFKTIQTEQGEQIVGRYKYE